MLYPRLFRADRILALILLVVANATAQAQSTTVFNDTFADAERSTQSLPRSVPWYQNGNQPANLAVRNGALNFVVGNASRTVWSYLPSVSLNVGESISLTLEFSFTAPVNNGFRLGLCHTNGVPPRTSDGAGPTGAYQGYGLENLGLIKRSGAGGLEADTALLNQLATADRPVWEPIGGAGIRGVRGAPLQPNLPYTLVLIVRRTGTDTANVTATLVGGGFTDTNTITLTDAANIVTQFDTVGIAFVGNTLSGDMNITRANVTTTLAPSNAGRLVNMSIRTNASTGDNTLIVGVGIGRGAGTKPALFRAVGPTLGVLGVGGALADPIITAFQGTTAIATNDDWLGGFDFATVGAFAFSGNAPRDAALYNIAVPVGSYSLQITGKNNGTGIALAEIYDATPPALFTSTTPRLVNVSARTQVGTGDNILIAGFVVGGTTPLRVLVRAVGPTLAEFGVGGALANPKLELFNAASVKVAENDDWAGTVELKNAFSAVGAFGFASDGSRDAALVTMLTPGSYTAQITGVNATTGVALVEVYEVP